MAGTIVSVFLQPSQAGFFLRSSNSNARRSGAGRVEEASLIQEQAVRLQEAVKAAHVRTSRRPANRSTRLRKMLLKPLKMFCTSSATSGHALALPAGIQDSDLVSC